MIGYVKHFDSNKTTSFKVDDNRLLNKYTKICLSILKSLHFNEYRIW